MPKEPSVKRAIAFFDGQNLFHAARIAFGYSYPNYDVQALAETICTHKGWKLVEIRFYTGMPNAHDDPFQHAFWSAKLASMGHQGVKIFSYPLRNVRERVKRSDGTERKYRVRREKGVDIGIALDVIRGAHQAVYDVALIFSQDQILSLVSDDIRAIAREQDRWIKMACAFPDNAGRARGIDKTDWIPIDRKTYDDCLDVRDYRPKVKRERAGDEPSSVVAVTLQEASPSKNPINVAEKSETGLKVFVSYSHKDENFRDELYNHLSMLMRENTIAIWYDRMITAGQEFASEIDEKIKTADIILLLVSSDFLASEYCYDIEVQHALQRRAVGEARVIPVILRHCDWHAAPFGNLMAIPRDGKAVADRKTWHDNDEAWFDVAKSIRKVAKELLEPKL